MARTLTLILIALAAALAAQRNGGQMSPDFLATWMAGEAFATGNFAAIYPAPSEIFTMRPPEAWLAPIREGGYDGPVYPFIYPPLWAWAAGLLTQITDYTQVARVATWINPVLLGLTLWAAAGLARGRLPEPVFVGLGLLICSQTTITLVALEQNQPQIAVACLTVLAMERVARGSPRTGGALLALAAAIKLYPALFALFWLARRERTAFGSFLIVGLGLGLLSLAVAGPALHLEFLSHVRAISGTVFVIFFNHSIDAVIGDFFFSHAMTSIQGADASRFVTWEVMAKPPVWSALNAVALIGAIVTLFRFARRTDDPLFWPLVFTVFALLSPLSWAYHYIASIAFLPALLDRLKPGVALLTMAVLLAPTSILYTLSSGGPLPFIYYGSLLATGAMGVWAGLCLVLAAGARGRGLNSQKDLARQTVEG